VVSDATEAKHFLERPENTINHTRGWKLRFMRGGEYGGGDLSFASTETQKTCSSKITATQEYDSAGGLDVVDSSWGGRSEREKEKSRGWTVQKDGNPKTPKKQKGRTDGQFSAVARWGHILPGGRGRPFPGQSG